MGNPLWVGNHYLQSMLLTCCRTSPSPTKDRYIVGSKEVWPHIPFSTGIGSIYLKSNSTSPVFLKIESTYFHCFLYPLLKTNLSRSQLQQYITSFPKNSIYLLSIVFFAHLSQQLTFWNLLISSVGLGASITIARVHHQFSEETMYIAHEY